MAAAVTAGPPLPPVPSSRSGGAPQPPLRHAAGPFYPAVGGNAGNATRIPTA